MKPLLILLIVAAILLLGLAYLCYRLAFFSNRNKKETEEYPIPPGKVYEPYRDTMIGWIKDVRNTPHEDIEIQSFDGLTLRGSYYEHSPGAPIELMLHGYRGSAERDMCGGMHRCFALKKNALIVDQRASGRSDGHVISFGINESRDCLAWVDYLIGRFGPDVKIILTGISMGAATVMIAAGKELPPNVIGVLADCGYTSAKDIIKKVIRQIHLPANLLYPFVKLGAKLFGHFDLEETSPIESMGRCKIPVIFFHGETDNFVPCDMSRENFAACTGPKQLFTVPNAGHGVACLVDWDGYIAKLDAFSKEHGWE